MGFPARYKGICMKCGEVVEVGQYVSWSRRSGHKGVYHVDCANVAHIPAESEKETAPVELVEKGEENNQENEVQAALEILGKVFRPKTQKVEIDESLVLGIIKKYMTEQGTLTIEVKQTNFPTVKVENAHNMFDTLLKYVAKGRHVYLYGPAGSGKSTAAHMVAKALNRRYGYISLNPQTPESRLLGYMNAMGEYVRTELRECYENGGVFCIDENDNAGGSLLTTLNGPFENGHMAFPDKIVSRHVDFVVVATGNTCGRGANPQYPDRRPFDSAYAKRFTYLAWGYDEKLERKVALAINPDADAWVNWMVRLRGWVDSTKSRLIASPRETYRIVEDMRDGFPVNIALNGALWNGDTELEKKALAANPLPV